MGIADRDYNRRPSPNTRSGLGGGIGSGQGLNRLHTWSVNTWIIVINIAIHLLALFVFSSASPFGRGNWSLLHDWGHFSTQQGFFRIEVWRLITFQFLHDPNSIWHIGLNMFGLWVFGPMVEQTLGRKKYLAFYLTCGIGGGLLYVILSVLGNIIGPGLPLLLVGDWATPLVGASAGVFGVIVACAYLSPNSRVQLLFPPIPIKMTWFAYGYVALAMFNLLTGGNNAGGDAAHIGGAIAGYFFIRRPHLLLDFFDIFNDSRPAKQKTARARSKPGSSDAEIDRILDKVSREGLQSLSEREKQALERKSRGGS